MAITKTVFRDDSLALQASEILAWLQTNATEYFDNITYDADNSKIVCEIGLLPALELFFTNNVAFTAYLSNGNSISYTRAYSGNSTLFYAGVKTTNGLIISYYNDNLPGYGHINYIVITKNNEDDVTFIAHGQDTPSTNSSCRLKTGSFSKYVWTDWYGNASNTYMFGPGYFMGAQTGLTSLVPFVDATYPIYTPNCYKLVFNQYFGTAGIFTIDGVSYYTTGYIALSDG